MAPSCTVECARAASVEPSSSPEETSTIAKRSGEAERSDTSAGGIGAGPARDVRARSRDVALRLLFSWSRAAGDAASAQLAGAEQDLRVGLPARPEELGVVVRQRALVRGAEQVLAVDQRALVVEDRGLDGALQELVGVAAEELVERVLAGDVHGQPAPRRSIGAPGAAPHLAQRGDRAGERDDDRGVERADVDAELERVGRDHGAQLAAHQPALELAALLGGVAGAVGDDELGELGVASARGRL